MIPASSLLMVTKRRNQVGFWASNTHQEQHPAFFWSSPVLTEIVVLSPGLIEGSTVFSNDFAETMR